MQKRVGGIDGLRGIAALVIAQFHMYFLQSQSGYAFEKKLALGYKYGWFMVEFFFVLSGFVMATSAICKKMESGGAFYTKE